ncbi:MAG: alpha/beta hydrolase [Rhodoferax sp.]|uniref:alpha/beta fold hydrolase n=1 Tax=Rhodoferax sp. TaxID=50421 RepID=UPI0027350B33|nr:alpha/beta hydrolase [Rhodoferax sp.]MDP2679050.1 alpha/beta hydrolase [Rhodoferax sp.]
MNTLSQSQNPYRNFAEFSAADNCSPASAQRCLTRRSDEVVIEYYAQGSGPVMVLLPSLGRGATDMLELAQPLSAAGWRVLRPEPRGNGGSVGPLEGKTLHDWAGDIASVIEDDGAAPVWVLGHAHGNWIARTLASDRPDLVRGLILLAGSAGKVPRGVDAVPIPPAVRASIESCAEPDLPDAERLVHLQHVFFAPGNDASVWLTGWNRHLMAMQTAAQKRTPVDDFFAGGQAPILNVQANHDVVAPPCYANVLKEYLGGRVTNRSIDNAGHALLPEQLDAVVEAILGYVAVAVSSGEADRV